MADTEANRRAERTGTLKSLTSILKPPTIKIKRKHLARYSWLPDVFRYDKSVIRNIAVNLRIKDFMCCSKSSRIIAFLDTKGKRINLTNNVVPLLSVVVGLILVFRTSYDRWAEGRRDFGNMTANIRNLARNVWTAVQLPPEQSEAVNRYMKSLPTHLQPPQLHRVSSESSSSAHQAAAQNLAVGEHLKNEKIRVVKLLIAFAIAAKHHLRHEPGIEYEDYIGLLPPELYREESSGWERTYSTSPDHEFSAGGPQPSSSKSHYMPTKPATATTPLLGDSHRAVEFHAYHERKHMPLPLIIAHEITRALYRFKRFSCLDIVGYAMHNAMQTLVGGMVDQLTSMERVSTTPIPASCKFLNRLHYF
ncbi:hypothetical protein CPB86DRAFT_804616 [Serendipita vermifera]|nr:hypothetical protein CPB86DRAFT_804616 [Serendipita vermifera]